jgi:hypothetical protein
VNKTPLLGAPLTVTTTFPVVTPGGTGTGIAVELQFVGVALKPLKDTVLEPCAAPKFAPLIVTETAVSPSVGDRLVIPAPDPITKGMPLLGTPPTVTTTFPVVAPLGGLLAVSARWETIWVVVRNRGILCRSRKSA